MNRDEVAQVSSLAAKCILSFKQNWLDRRSSLRASEYFPLSVNDEFRTDDSPTQAAPIVTREIACRKQ
jgi:hypothetical protein